VRPIYLFTDIRELLPLVEAQMSRILRNRKQRDEEKLRKRGQEVVRRRYDCLRSNDPIRVLPPFQVFRRFPVMKVVESGEVDAETSRRDLNDARTMSYKVRAMIFFSTIIQVMARLCAAP
jgi:hypothetical protein